MERKVMIQKINARMLHWAEAYMDRIYGPRKRSVFRELPSVIVEIGAGTGANFPYYAPGTRVIAVEPSVPMHAPLKANAHQWKIDLDIRTMMGEEMDLETGSIEAVVGTLVLCSVEDPRRVLSEVLRILQRGGSYIFLEHIAAPPGSRLRGMQNLLQRPWSWITEGCQLNRNTHALLQNAGFHKVDMDCFMLQSSLLPVTPHIFGRAVK